MNISKSTPEEMVEIFQLLKDNGYPIWCPERVRDVAYFKSDRGFRMNEDKEFLTSNAASNVYTYSEMRKLILSDTYEIY